MNNRTYGEDDTVLTHPAAKWANIIEQAGYLALGLPTPVVARPGIKPPTANCGHTLNCPICGGVDIDCQAYDPGDDYVRIYAHHCKTCDRFWRVF